MHLALYRKGKRKDPPCKLCRDFVPHFHPERLKQPWEVKTPSKVFMCSTSDLFASWTRLEWRDAVLKSIEQCPIKHDFQLLTKQPQLIPLNHEFPDNIWIGATVTQQSEVDKIDALRKVNCKVHFVSFEPILGPINADLSGIQWIIIGKLTGSRRVQLQEWWVDDLSLDAMKLGIPIFLKNNLGYENPLQEFPRVKKG